MANKHKSQLARSSSPSDASPQISVVSSAVLSSEGINKFESDVHADVDIEFQPRGARSSKTELLAGPVMHSQPEVSARPAVTKPASSLLSVT